MKTFSRYESDKRCLYSFTRAEIQYFQEKSEHCDDFAFKKGAFKHSTFFECVRVFNVLYGLWNDHLPQFQQYKVSGKRKHASFDGHGAAVESRNFCQLLPRTSNF